MTDAKPTSEDISQYLEDEETDAEIRARDFGFMFRFLWPYLKPYRRKLALVLGLLALQTVFNASFPLATQYLIDQGLIERNWNALVFVLIFLSIAAIIVSVISIANDYLYSRIFSNVVKDLRIALFEQIQRLPMPFFLRTPSGGILSRFSGDIVASETMLVQMIPWLALPLLEVIYSTILMFYFNVWLGLIGLLIFPTILAGPSIFSRKAFALSYDKRTQEADILSAAQENIQAQPVIKAFALHGRSTGHFRGLNLSWMSNAFRVYFFSALAESTAYMGVYIIHIVIIVLGAYWAYTEEITIGTLVAFESMFVSMGYALTNLTQFVPTLAQATGSMQHLNEIFEEKPSLTDAPNATVLPPMRDRVAFEHTTFAYPGGKTVLHNVSFDVPRHAYVAIVGRSGSGKSTILNLLMRFYDPTEGRVAIDGHDIRTITQDSLRAQIGIVFQDSFLFNASISDNIRMGKADATDQEIESALRAAESRAAASGSRSDQRATGGGPSPGTVERGSASPGSFAASSTAANQYDVSRRCERPRNTGSAASAPGVAGAVTAASTIAESGRTRPGAMSRSAASRSRASHSARTAASGRGLRTLWMPDVRRHGSARGAGGGAVRTASNSCSAKPSLPCSASMSASRSRSSTSTSTSSAA